jgi:hypothetical protein
MLSDIIKISFIGVAALSAYGVYTISKTFIGAKEEVRGVQAVAANDLVDDQDESEVTPYVTVRRVRARFLDHCVAEAKNNFPVLVDSRADRAMVYEFLCKLMKGYGMRPTHIQQNVYGMVNRVMIPNQFAITAEKVMASSAVQVRTEALGKRWRSVFRPFGRDMRPITV